jgi:hypothetical protein
MKPEALDDILGHTTRPSALEAAVAATPGASTAQVDGTSSQRDDVRSHARLSTPSNAV